ncbi:hypothetical protein [Myroides sp. WP-1]|uniref:hypothetical protein n=1 Tax=Myroides sp. WP-1 TaxID=2759944 RepID=UPI0015F94365|nr:hypothetical protein [Myroides sp. WP-1]MBB1140554.1 hypothetical protein [Myroides sp. WP-1]
MLDSVVLKQESLRQDDYFDEFLVLLENKRKQGRNYLSLSKIPISLHYRLIQEGYSIKKEKKVVTRYFFWKKIIYYYKVERST